MKSKFKKIVDAFNIISTEYEDEIANVLIKPIHEDFLFAQNGICAFISGMGRGKTDNYLKMIAQEEVLFPNEFF